MKSYKVVYISPHRDGTGYAKAAIGNMLAMDSVGIDVVARHVRMTNGTGDVPDKVKEFERKDLNGVDVVIQHNLPSQFEYIGGVQNIGAFAYESIGTPLNNWKNHLSIMDKVVVFCGDQLNDDKRYVIPHALDVSKFDKDWETIDFGLPESTIKFYTICDASRRKNLPALLIGYLSEFTSSDDVTLIIKTYGYSGLSDLVEEIKTKLNIYKDTSRYPQVIAINSFMTDDQINSLHKTCDAFVTTSHGESFSIPSVEAQGFGNIVIAPAHSSFLDYIYDRDLLINSYLSPCFGMENSPDNLYSGKEMWYNVDISDFRSRMRKAASYIDQFKNRQDKRREYVDRFSYENIGNKWLEVLNAN